MLCPSRSEWAACLKLHLPTPQETKISERQMSLQQWSNMFLWEIKVNHDSRGQLIHWNQSKYSQTRIKWKKNYNLLSSPPKVQTMLFKAISIIPSLLKTIKRYWHTLGKSITIPLETNPFQLLQSTTMNTTTDRSFHQQRLQCSASSNSEKDS